MKTSEAWDDIPKEGITYCTKCGAKIWKYWHKKINFKDVEMTKCGNCYFRRQ